MTADEELRRASGEIELLTARLQGAARDAAALRREFTALEASIGRSLTRLGELRASVMEEES